MLWITITVFFVLINYNEFNNYNNNFRKPRSTCLLNVLFLNKGYLRCKENDLIKDNW